MTAVDASAVGRLLVRDVGAADLRELLASDDDLFGSDLLLAEVLRIGTRLHLGIALRLEQTELLIYDRQQTRAAEVSGLQVLSPGMSDGWWRG